MDGMLGGYGHISGIDISSSRKFLQRFLRVGGSGVLSRSEDAARLGCRGATSYAHRRGAFGCLLALATQASRARAGVACGLGPLSPGRQTGTGRRAGASRRPNGVSRQLLRFARLSPWLSRHVRSRRGRGCWLFGFSWQPPSSPLLPPLPSSGPGWHLPVPLPPHPSPSEHHGLLLATHAPRSLPTFRLSRSVKMSETPWLPFHSFTA